VTPTPNILIHEYISGGGWPDHKLPEKLMAEGLSMLRTILADFRDWGKATVTTTRDHRLTAFSLPADRVVDLDSSDHYETLKQLTKECTAALIIAPESGGILERLSLLMEQQRVQLLGSSPGSIARAANKWDCYRLFHQAGLATPDTWCVSIKNAIKTAEEIGYPLVLKPIDGVGCEGVGLINDTASLLLALEKHSCYKDHLLLQRYIKGHHVSVSLLIAEDAITCLSLNKQSIQIGSSFSYQGGEIPFICGRQKEAFDLAKRAATLLHGLKGYVGVDMLITDKGCYLIEINPRLTTSYTGLRKVVNINLAGAIWDASIEGILPQKICLSGKALLRNED